MIVYCRVCMYACTPQARPDAIRYLLICASYIPYIISIVYLHTLQFITAATQQRATHHNTSYHIISYHIISYTPILLRLQHATTSDETPPPAAGLHTAAPRVGVCMHGATAGTSVSLSPLASPVGCLLHRYMYLTTYIHCAYHIPRYV